MLSVDRQENGRGYVVGPTLAAGESPWPLQWESSVDEMCAHEWEIVSLPEWHGRRAENVVRCAACHVPRCGESTCDDPCMERRHHHGLHIYLSGRWEPLGGILAEEVPQ